MVSNLRNRTLAGNGDTQDERHGKEQAADETPEDVHKEDEETIDEDEEVAEYDIEGSPLMNLSDNSDSVVTVKKIVSRILNSN